MGGGGSNKPIVFVFGTQKGDADGRKKNLSAINTQVAYRAHERRREKKSKQRAQAKEDGKVDQQTGTTSNTTNDASSISQPPEIEDNVNFNHFVPASAQGNTKFKIVADPNVPPNFTASNIPRPDAEASQLVPLLDVQRKRRPYSDRRESDLSSDNSSVSDAVWSSSPGSNRHSSPATDLSSASPLAPLSLNSYFEKALDPFFRLPTVASEREKWLVHFYFREMGHIGFGTHQNSLFCPDRDWVSKYVSSKSLCFQWVLILAEEQLGRMGIMPDQTNTIERKAKAYGALNATLRSRAADRDEGISGIMYAAIVDTARASMHLMALDRFINETGGFEAFLDGPLGIAHPEHVATVYAFGRCPIPNLKDFEMTKDRFLSMLRILHEGSKQEREEKRRIRNRRPWDTLSRQVIDGNGVLVPASHDEHFRYYTKAQQDCFACDSLAHLLNSTLDTQADYPCQARHLATLVQTLMILREFESNYLARAMFLKRLKYVAEMSTARDASTNRAHITHAGLLLINSFVRQEVQTYFDRTKALTKAVTISRVVVDCLKINALLSEVTRSLLVSWLRDWLCYDDQFEDVEFAPLQENELTNIGSELTDAWMRSMSNSPR